MINIDNEILIKLTDLTLDGKLFCETVPPEYIESHNGGVYILRAFQPDNKNALEISLFLKPDPFRVLYIGKADIFTHRTGDLARAIDQNYSQSKPEAGTRYITNLKIKEKCPRDDLFVNIIISSGAEKLEGSAFNRQSV